MSLKSKYKLWMDELHRRIEEDFGYSFEGYDDELRTKKKKSDGSYYFEDMDEIRLPSEYGAESESIDEIRIQSTRNNSQRSQDNAESGEDITSPHPIPNAVRKRFDDDFLEYLIFAYGMGVQEAGEMLGIDTETDTERMMESITKVTKGKTYQQRLDEYYITGNIEAIIKVADTEAHRVINDGIEDTGKAVGAKYKTWVTMMDDRVRDTHWHLENLTIPFDERFYSIDGDSALKPGGFENADNNINCRCILKLSNQP